MALGGGGKPPGGSARGDGRATGGSGGRGAPGRASLSGGGAPGGGAPGGGAAGGGAAGGGAAGGGAAGAGAPLPAPNEDEDEASLPLPTFAGPVPLIGGLPDPAFVLAVLYSVILLQTADNQLRRYRSLEVVETSDQNAPRVEEFATLVEELHQYVLQVNRIGPPLYPENRGPSFYASSASSDEKGAVSYGVGMDDTATGPNWEVGESSGAKAEDDGGDERASKRPRGSGPTGGL